MWCFHVWIYVSSGNSNKQEFYLRSILSAYIPRFLDSFLFVWETNKRPVYSSIHLSPVYVAICHPLLSYLLRIKCFVCKCLYLHIVNLIFFYRLWTLSIVLLSSTCSNLVLHSGFLPAMSLYSFLSELWFPGHKEHRVGAIYCLCELQF